MPPPSVPDRHPITTMSESVNVVSQWMPVPSLPTPPVMVNPLMLTMPLNTLNTRKELSPVIVSEAEPGPVIIRSSLIRSSAEVRTIEPVMEN